MTSVISAITSVFDAIMTWLGDAVSSVSTMFYTPEAGLTFIGTLAVVGLAFSVVFLIMGIIQNFLHLRG